MLTKQMRKMACFLLLWNKRWYVNEKNLTWHMGEKSKYWFTSVRKKKKRKRREKENKVVRT